MIRLKGKVHYEDGTVEEFETGNAAMRSFERYAQRNKISPKVEDSPTEWALVVAHYALRVPEGFDVWVESVDAVDIDTEEVPPTPPAASAG